jgi:hypothetical protein
MSVPVGRGRRGEHLHARPPGLEDVDVRTRPKLRARDRRAVVGDAPFTLLGLLVAVLKLNVSDEGGNQGCQQRPSLAISGHPRPSEAHRTYGEVRKQSEAIRSHQKHSEAIRSHPKPSEAIRSP